MYQVSNLGKRYADNLLFDKVNLTINRGDRFGLVGPNGCGKTTLLRILTGEELPDSGAVRRTAPGVRLGYLPQALTFDAEATVADVLAGTPAQEEERLATQVQELAERLAAAQGAELAALERAYTSAVEQLGLLAEALPDYQVEAVLAGLGLDHVQPRTPVRILSGGQKTRLGLARLLLQNPSLLLLDEPTNHLDITALEWLEGYLRGYAGAMLIVSHDRTFLDHIVTGILEMDHQEHTVRAYPGNYSAYAQTKERERERAWQAYQEQEERIERLESAVRKLKDQASRIEHETIAFYYRKRAKKVAHQGVVRQERIQRIIASEDHLDKPKQHWDMKLAFVNTPASGQDVLLLEEVSKSYGAHTLFAGVNLLLKQGERIALLGANGTGKTTLLRIITGQEPPTAGTVRRGANVRIGYFSQEQEALDGRLTPLETVRRAAPLSDTEARSFLHFFLFAGDDVFVPVSSLSYGERARLALGTLVLQGCNLLLLDEPINHLDIPSRESFEQALASYEGTVIAVVHDRYFVERFASGVWAIADGQVHRYVDLVDAQRDSASPAPAPTLPRAWGEEKGA